MKPPRISLTAAALPLLLTSLHATAGELPFKAPDTARAQETAQLLHQAAQALGDLPTTSALAAQGQHIANLWIFPTADSDTVFAQYDLTSNEAGAPSTQHLTVLKVNSNRIVERTELTDERTYSASGDERPSATPHWTASIGTGHASSTEVTPSSHGVPANPHWTALIGTGAAASSVAATDSKQVSSSNKQSAVADAHWTAKIGTGHATESNGQERT
jgi:hypothetical protein